MTEIQFLSYLKHEKRYSEKTIISYRNDLKQFSEFLFNQFTQPEVIRTTSKQVRAWVVYQIKSSRLIVNFAVFCVHVLSIYNVINYSS